MKKNDFENNDFDLVNLPKEAQDPEIKAEDFTLQQVDGSIHEQKFQTKPTTFLKDSLKRFRKNKSSVVAAYILGALILLAIFVPIFDKNDVSNAANSAYSNLEPKLFDAGTGWWDGTKHVSDCPVDPFNDNMPDPEIYLPGGVTNKVVEGEKYTNTPNKYGKEGYAEIGYFESNEKKEGILYTYNTGSIHPDDYFALDLDEVTLTVTDFNVADLEKLTAIEGKRKKNYELPENFDLGEISLEFVCVTAEEELPITVIEPSVVHNIGFDPTQYGLDPAKYDGNDPINITEIIREKLPQRILYEGLNDFYFRLVVKRGPEPEVFTNVCSLVRSLVITPSFTREDYPYKDKVIKFFSEESDTRGVTGISFTDAMQLIYRPSKFSTSSTSIKNTGYWMVVNEVKYVKRIYLGRSVFASFDYDSYAATLGPRDWIVTKEEFQHYKNKKWVDFNFPLARGEDGKMYINTADQKYRPFTIRNKSKSPVLETFDVSDVVIDQEEVGGDYVWYVRVKVLFYKYLDETATEMPKFLFGTDKTGRDMFKYVFEGLRNSLALGVVTFIVCFAFGLLWGAISGYFGGAVDLVMERFTDILSGIPWIVVMTLIILKADESSFGVFALALCLTGWIGTASTTRTQFYRFRGREYVLATRTLGASDARLIAKHILPNALGTIITGAVLMIPSVIFSEATISYLGLGFKDLSSLGVILSNNQSELTNHPYQLIFPSVVIALVMISFNLFGNGLRDAINPSLKGEDE